MIIRSEYQILKKV